MSKEATFLKNKLLEDEHIIWRAEQHKIFWFSPIMVILITILFVGLNTPFGMALILLGIAMIISRNKAEYVITNKRVLIRRGAFTSYIDELNNDSISTAYVLYPLLGRIFKFGNVIIVDKVEVRGRKRKLRFYYVKNLDTLKTHLLDIVKKEKIEE